MTLWDVSKDFEQHVKSAQGFSGTVELEGPRDKLHEPRVTIEAADGSETTSAKLEIAAVATHLDLGTMRIWPAKVAYQRDGSRVRFSWPPITGPDVPATIRYSLLFVYKNEHGEEAEGTFVTKGECEAVRTISELSEIFPDRDARVKTMTMRIRVYSGSGPEGSIWAGPKQTWTVHDDLPVSPPGPK
ncbi:MAG: hypothetical protein ACAI25_09815 [Planctomycetota bacterium]